MCRPDENLSCDLNDFETNRQNMPADTDGSPVAFGVAIAQFSYGGITACDQTNVIMAGLGT